MTALEDRLRGTLHDTADEVVAVPLLQRLERSPQAHPSRRRLVAVVAAAAAAATVVATSYVALRPDEPGIIEPVVRPPKVFRLSDVTSTSPGRADLAVVLSGHGPAAPVYLLPSSGGDAILLPESAQVPGAWTQQLSADGTRLVRQSWESANPRLEIVNLVSGGSDDLHGIEAFCPAISPDNGTVAVMSGSFAELGVVLIDVRTGTSVRLRAADEEGDCGYNTFGWSPDGQRLVVRDRGGSVLVDRHGAFQLRLPGRTVSNGSMSWSPDGASILVYERSTGEYLVVDTDDGAAVSLRPPTGGIETLGWAGSRIVWLVGDPGDQQLVTTDRRGDDPQAWMRLDVGDRGVETVQWSTDLSGAAAD